MMMMMMMMKRARTDDDGDAATDTQSLLPEDLIVDNILRRLPVKSLIRFRSVSKLWRSLVDAPSFITQHLRHHQSAASCLLFPGKRNNRPLQLRRLLDGGGGVQLQPWVFELDSASSSIVGSSNGLLCLRIHKEFRPPTFLLWNPAIGDLRMTPSAVGSGKGRFFHVGFGFSPIINDYKIVIIRPADYPFRVQVYSLTSGSWEVVESNMLDGIRLNKASVTVNGAMFWCGAKDNDAHMIVSFDIASQVFSFIPLPVVLNPNLYYRFAVYDNKLAMLVKTPLVWEESSSKPATIDLWVMMDEGRDVAAGGVRWSWIKKCNASLSCNLTPLTIWDNEIVCNVVEYGRERIALLNVATSEFNMFALHEYEECIHYVESLVPLGGTKLHPSNISVVGSQ